MSEGITAENLLSNIVETLSDSVSKQKASSFLRKISQAQSVLSLIDCLDVKSQSTIFWGVANLLMCCCGGTRRYLPVFWLVPQPSGCFLNGSITITFSYMLWFGTRHGSSVCLVKCIWFLKRSPSSVRRIQLPDELFVDVAKSVGAEINHALVLLQDIACNGNIKQFSVAVGSLLVAAIIGSWCNFLTVLYIGLFVRTCYRFCMKSMKTKLTTLCTMSWTSFSTITGRWIPASSAKFPKGSSK